MAEGPRSAEPRLRDGERAQVISRSMVRLMSEYTGRGPTKARTYLHEYLVVCVLQDTLTKGEREMAARGEERIVLETRRTYQRLMRTDAAKMVEEQTGQPVVAFLSDNHIEPDVAIEAFVLGDPRPAQEERQP